MLLPMLYARHFVPTNEKKFLCFLPHSMQDSSFVVSYVDWNFEILFSVLVGYDIFLITILRQNADACAKQIIFRYGQAF